VILGTNQMPKLINNNDFIKTDQTGLNEVQSANNGLKLTHSYAVGQSKMTVAFEATIIIPDAT
jgi:hypothetical protein